VEWRRGIKKELKKEEERVDAGMGWVSISSRSPETRVRETRVCWLLRSG
jgi:hypothetical protein